MKSAKIVGAMLPTIEEYRPILDGLRKKYDLAEISPDDEPIKEIYFEDQIIPLEDFHKEILDLVEKNSDFLFDDKKLLKLYKEGKKQLGKPLKLKGYERLLPKKTKEAISNLYDISQKITELIVNLVDQQYKAIADIIYIYLLTGEAQEAPQDWFCQVGVAKVKEDPIVFAMASQISDPEYVVHQFRKEYAKTFGQYQPKLTNTMVSTAHYLQLQRMGKPWNYIVGEFIRLNNLQLPRDRNSLRYAEIYKLYEDRLKKRMLRTRTILEVIARDIN